MHYEKFGDGSVKCIEDEIPFELPEGWAWCRIKNISIIGTGATPLKSNSAYYKDGTIPWITSAATSEASITVPADYITDLALTETNCTIYPVGTLIIAMYGEGKTRGQISELNIEACTNQACAALRVLSKSKSLKQYVKIYFQYSYENLRHKSKGGQQPNLSQTIIADTLISIPPYKETERVIAFASDCFDLVDAIEGDKAAVLDDIDSIKKCILDLAIRGQLVPQDPNDEPASVLLERIRAEKEALIKAGKIKRDKRESVIFRGEDNSYYLKSEFGTEEISNELPFEIPDSWEWGKIGDIMQVNPRNKLEDSLEVSFIPMPLIEDGFSGKHSSDVRPWKSVKSGFTHFMEGDIGIAKITPCFENRKSVVFENLTNGYGAGTTELHILRPYTSTILAEYVLAYVKSPMFIDNGVQAFSGAVGQQRIGKDYVEGSFFPVPPLMEQARIIKQIAVVFEQLDIISNAFL